MFRKTEAEVTRQVVNIMPWHLTFQVTKQFFGNLHNLLFFGNFEYDFKTHKSMKKLDSNQDEKSLHEELQRLRKENKKLASQKDKLKAKYETAQKELKKKDVRKITLTEEQHRLLSSLFPDIDSLL